MSAVPCRPIGVERPGPSPSPGRAIAETDGSRPSAATKQAPAGRLEDRRMPGWKRLRVDAGRIHQCKYVRSRSAVLTARLRQQVADNTNALRVDSRRARSASRSHSAASCKHSSTDFGSRVIVVCPRGRAGPAIRPIPAQPCSRNTDRKAHLDPTIRVGPCRHLTLTLPRLERRGAGGQRTFQYPVPNTIDRAPAGECSVLNKARNLRSHIGISVKVPPACSKEDRQAASCSLGFAG